MKLIAILICIIGLTGSYASVYSQQTKLKLNVQNATVKDVLKLIEDQSEFSFMYNASKIDVNRKIDLNEEKSSLEDILKKVFEGENVSFKVMDRNVIITKDVNEEFSVLQQKSVSGKVTDSSGGSLPGVSVVVKGTTTGVITDMDGKYSLSNIAEKAVLQFSFVGMKMQEISVEGKTSINVVLEDETIGIEEVVAIGYGTVKIKDATGSVSSVSNENFNKGMSTSPEQLIQGKTAGVQITSASGEPGAGINVRIRGTSSIRSGNNPLFVVDGIPLGGESISPEGANVGMGGQSSKNPLNFLNSEDIESISVLKDASATAIYGSRGANGVVIITTKKGKESGGKLEYSSSASLSEISKKYDLLSKDEFLNGAEKLGANRAALDYGGNTDWQSQILRTAVSQNHNLSYGAGNDHGDFRASLSYLDQEGIIKESNMERYTARLNGNQKLLNDRLKLSTQLTLSSIKDNNVPVGNNANHYGDLMMSALYMNPTQPIYNSDGSFNQPAIDKLNPLAILAYTEDITETLKGLLSFSAEYNIRKNLSLKTSIGLDKSKSIRKYAYSSLLNSVNTKNIGLGGVSDVDIQNSLWESVLNYNTEINSSIHFDGLAGYSYQVFNNKSSYFGAAKFRTTDVNLMMNNIGAASNFVGNSGYTKDEIQSFFGRFNVSVKDKYLLTATLRADGSTKFGENNKYGYFPSLAFAWRISEEGFLPEVISNLKLRLGWGLTGNQEIPNNLIDARQRYGTASFNSSGVIQVSSLNNVTFANPDLKWESTSQINSGIDFGFFNNRIRGSFDYYYKSTNDLLIQITSAQPAPQPFYWTNLNANIVNSGVDFSLSTDIVDSKEFGWEISANMNYNKNIVKNFNGNIQTGSVNGQGLLGNTERIVNNRPLYSYYLRVFQGFDANGISTYLGGDKPVFTGDSPLPKFTMGLTNTLRYKKFDLSFFFSGQFGNKIYNNTANAIFYSGNLANGKNVTKNVLNNGESALNTAEMSTRFLEDGSFVRLQDVSLGYNVPVKSTKVLSSLRLYINGQNLLLFTNYSGQDPEVNKDKSVGGVPSLGMDYSTYPRAKTITFGIRAGF
jgi:iron complex outermembrane receptor protein